METKKQRDSNIELLRILIMVGIIVLHYNNPSIGGALNYVPTNSTGFWLLYFLESLCACAVDLFILISGYFMCKSSSKSILKPLQLLIQVIIFGIGTYILKVLLSQQLFSFAGIALSAIPSNWFVILYIALYMISPYLNTTFLYLSKQAFEKMLVVGLLLFSIWPTLVDLSAELLGKEWVGLCTVGMYGSQWGYSIVNFVLLYVIGSYLRLYCSEIQSKKKLIGLLVLCVTILVGWAKLNDYTGFFTEKSAWEYCNPIVILEASIIFCIFKSIKMKTNAVLNRFAQGAFTVFLLQNFFIRQLHIEAVASSSVALLIIHLFLSCIIIYLICWAIFFVYDKITSPIYNHIIKYYNIPSIEISG